MQTPLEIAFHNCSASPWVEEEVRKHLSKLEKLHDRITACRVSIEENGKQPAGHNFDVHVDLTVPGSALVVSRAPKTKEGFGNPDLRLAIREAFRVAERQLKDFKEKLASPGAPAPAPE